jgi:polynucleotide 5'-kinase involved in rRNA processing
LQKARLGEILHAEETGGALFLVAEDEPSEGALARALDIFHCTRAFVASPSLYNGLLCSFVRQTGEDFGFGLVRSIDFVGRVAHVLCDAVPPRAGENSAVRIATNRRVRE